MLKCPRCNGTTVTDTESGEIFCQKCGFVITKEMIESKFKEKDEMRSTNEHGGWDSDVQTAPKSVSAYGGTNISKKDAFGKIIGGYDNLRKQDRRSNINEVDHLKKDHNKMFEGLIRRIIPVQQTSLQEQSLMPLYVRCLESTLMKGNDAELIMIGLICIYLKKEKIPWRGNNTIYEIIEKETGRNKQEVLSIMNSIMRKFDWGIEYGFYQKSYDEIARIIKKIKEDDNSFRELKISKRAREIIDKVSNDGLTGGISPKNQAGAAIFLACNAEDLAVSLDDIAVYCDTNKHRIMPHIKKFNSVLKYDLNF